MSSRQRGGVELGRRRELGRGRGGGSKLARGRGIPARGQARRGVGKAPRKARRGAAPASSPGGAAAVCPREGRRRQHARARPSGGGARPRGEGALPAGEHAGGARGAGGAEVSRRRLKEEGD